MCVCVFFSPMPIVYQLSMKGANMLTVTSNDQTFEYHLQLSQASKIVFTERETPSKTFRIIRLLNAQGEALSSFILVDATETAIAWFRELIASRGSEIQL